MLKFLLFQLLASNYNGTIMDIEGFEYIPLANFVSHKSKVTILNMAEGSGNYFDPVEIFDPVGIEEIDKDAKKMSINFTTAIYKTLLGRAYEQDVWLETVVSDMVSKLYSDAGVTDDMSTWALSKGKTLHDGYQKLLEIQDKQLRKDEGYLSAVEKAIATMGRYFEKDGIYASMFKKRVAVSELIDADLVVCSFGMAGKSQHSIDSTQLALMQLGAAQLSHQRSIFSKAKGKFNFKVWEEFQRWGNFPDSDKTLGVAVTGGRKLGDVNIILTNDVGKILKDDKFSILPNVTSFLIGAIADKDVRDELCDRLSIPLMKSDLSDIAAAKRDDSDAVEGDYRKDESSLTNSFLCGLDRSKYGIVKALVPEYLRRSKVFKTGVDLEGNT